MRPLFIITGPTGTGKSQLAARAAPSLNAEIVCADSRQLYRGMEIGTAQPDSSQRAAAPHHLYGEFDPRENVSAGAYRKIALERIGEIHERGRLPLLVGGTGFYLRALTGKAALAPPAEEGALRDAEREIQTRGAAGAWELLKSQDPAAASRIHPNDRYRLLRALAILKGTRCVSSSFGALPAPAWDIRWVALNLNRTELYSRIDARSSEMYRAGFPEEAARLRAAGLADCPAVAKAIGYRHAFDFLDGRTDAEAAIALTARDTRRYAKRQMTWLRPQTGLTWVDSADAEAALGRIIGEFRRR